MSAPVSMSQYESIAVGPVSAEFWQQCLNPQSATQRKEVNEFLKTHGYIWTRNGSDWMLTKKWQPSEVLDIASVVAELKTKQLRQQRAA
jgi:hypothetical protein